MAAQFVTPFRKSRGAKNDRNDAEAITTAARQGNMRTLLNQDTRCNVQRARAVSCDKATPRTVADPVTACTPGSRTRWCSGQRASSAKRIDFTVGAIR